jgi:hypothetical protein
MAFLQAAIEVHLQKRRGPTLSTCLA